MTGRPPFRRGKCLYVCVLMCLREREQGSMLASQSHRFSSMLVIVSAFYVHSWRDGLRGPFSRCLVLSFPCAL
jgi:hypothetical protein